MCAVLFLGHRIPDAPDKGDKIRASHVLEALAIGCPVIALSKAHEDFCSATPHNLLVADSPAGMAQTSSGVPARQHPGLGTASRAALERAYSWNATLTRLDRIIGSVSHEAMVG